MVPTLVVVASFLLCMGHRVASTPTTQTSPALFGISGCEWSAQSSASGTARFWISAKPGLSVTPILLQNVAIKIKQKLRYYRVPVVSAPGQKVHIQRFSNGHLQKVRVTVTYHPAPQTSFILSLGVTLTGSSIDMSYYRQTLMVIPAYTEPISSYNGSLAIMKVVHVPPRDITTTELRIKPPEFKIITPVDPYVLYIKIHDDNMWYSPFDSSFKTNHTEAGVATYSVNVSELNDTQLVERYLVSLSPSILTMATYESVSAFVNVHVPNSRTYGMINLASRPCNYYGFNGRDEAPVHRWTAGLANCVCCDIMAEPNPTVSIWKEGQQLTWQKLSRGESLLEYGTGTFESSVCLVVQEASERSAGSYTCQGQAGDGSSSTQSFTVAIRQA